MFKSVGEELAFNKRMGFWNKGKKSAAYVVSITAKADGLEWET